MKEELWVTGIVLSIADAGEYNKRVVILTKERGKIGAFVRGARKQGNSLLAECSPFSFGKFELFEGRDAYTVKKAEISNYFLSIREDLKKVCYGFYFLEMASYFTHENVYELEMLKLLYQTLRVLEKGTVEEGLIRRIYECRCLVIYGQYPDFFSCVRCGSRKKLRFSIEADGCLCEDCGGESRILPVEETVLYTLQVIVSSPIEKLYTFRLSEEIFARLEQIISMMCKKYIDREFHSLQMLDSFS